MRVLMNKFKEKSYIEGITEGVNFIPFTYSNEFLIDTFHVDDKKIIVQQRISDASAINVFHPVIEEGEWITDEKLEDGTFPVVITRNLADELFDGQAIGKKIFRRSRSFTVNGIISGIKGNIFDGAVDAVIFPWRAFQMYSSTKELAVRVKGDNKETFYNDYINEFRKSMKFKEAVVEPFVYDMDIFKRQSMASTLFDITLLLVPTVCLFLFAFVGTFGLFWLTSKKRRKEFALKMAIGSSKRRIMREVISESVLISLVSCVPGLIIAAFIYPIDGLHLAALGITLGLMLVFSIFSAWYPAFKVTKIQPAQVLKYE